MVILLAENNTKWARPRYFVPYIQYAVAANAANVGATAAATPPAPALATVDVCLKRPIRRWLGARRRRQVMHDRGLVSPI